jgi:hypothetical protein
MSASASTTRPDGWQSVSQSGPCVVLLVAVVVVPVAVVWWLIARS